MKPDWTVGGKSADMGGRPMQRQDKVRTVMKEFKSGKLKSSSGQKVTNPKQAIAIGLSEAGISKKKEGGQMKESKAMMKNEAGMKKGGKAKGYAAGGLSAGHKAADGVAVKGKTKGKQIAMRKGGSC